MHKYFKILTHTYFEYSLELDMFLTLDKEVQGPEQVEKA